jgi:hypothetical protein
VLPSQSDGCSFLSFAFLCVFFYFRIAIWLNDLSIREANYRYQQSIFHRNRNTDIDVMVVTDLISQPTAVHFWMLALMQVLVSFQHHIIKADLQLRRYFIQF